MNALQKLQEKYSSPKPVQSLAGKFFLKPEPEGKGKRKLVEELFRLLRGTPVCIVKTRHEFGLDQRSIRWRYENQEQGFKIADLVYGRLFGWLHRHPEARITADNLLQGLNK